MLIPLEGWGAKLIINGKEICEPSECMCNTPIDFLKAFYDLLSKEPDNRKATTVYIDCEGPEFYLTFYAGSILITEVYNGLKTEMLTGLNMKLLAKELIHDIENNWDYFSKWDYFLTWKDVDKFDYSKNLKLWLNKLKSIIED